MASTVMTQGTSMQKISILAPLLNEWQALNENLTLELGLGLGLTLSAKHGKN